LFDLILFAEQVLVGFYPGFVLGHPKMYKLGEHDDMIDGIASDRCHQYGKQQMQRFLQRLPLGQISRRVPVGFVRGCKHPISDPKKQHHQNAHQNKGDFSDMQPEKAHRQPSAQTGRPHKPTKNQPSDQAYPEKRHQSDPYGLLSQPQRQIGTRKHGITRFLKIRRTVSPFVIIITAFTFFVNHSLKKINLFAFSKHSRIFYQSSAKSAKKFLRAKDFPKTLQKKAVRAKKVLAFAKDLC
jgi:hypothetical protein